MSRTDVIIPTGGSWTSSDNGRTRTNIDAINASGTPISSNSASSLESLLNSYLGSMSSGSATASNFDFESYKKFILENTDKNNAWSAKQAQDQNAFQERQNQIAMEYNSAEAQKNRNWQEMMSNTAHQREIADLKAAGLNPVLSASGGNGAAVTSGATASGVTSSGAKGDTDTSANGAITSMLSGLISADTQIKNANLSARTNYAIAEKQQQMQYQIAQLNASIAQQQIASNYNLQMAQMQNQKEIASWSNPYQILGQIFDYMTGSSENSDPGISSAKDVNLNNIADVARAGLYTVYNRIKNPNVYVGKSGNHKMYKSTVQTNQ